MTQKPLILAVETSGRTGSVAVAAGEQMLAEQTFSAPMRHSAELLPAICWLLDQFGRKPEDIEHIYISIGPGSFTGLRIAATFAKTMHLANSNVKLVAVDTLDVIAANAIDYIKERNKATACHSERSEESIDKIAAILDAKRSQFFIAVYKRDIKHGIWKKTLPDSLMTADEFLAKFACRDEPIWLLGEGLVYHKDKFNADGVYFFDESYWYPRALKLHQLGWEKATAGQFAEPLTLQPSYLRKPDVIVKREQRKS